MPPVKCGYVAPAHALHEATQIGRLARRDEQHHRIVEQDVSVDRHRATLREFGKRGQISAPVGVVDKDLPRAATALNYQVRLTGDSQARHAGHEKHFIRE